MVYSNVLSGRHECQYVSLATYQGLFNQPSKLSPGYFKRPRVDSFEGSLVIVAVNPQAHDILFHEIGKIASC